MNLNKTDKEFIRAIVKYDGKAQSLADVLNKSRLLEKRGIGIVQHCGKNIIFLRKDIYEEWFDRNGLGYVAGLLSIIDTLIKKKYITMIPFVTDDILVIGAKNQNGLGRILFLLMTTRLSVLQTEMRIGSTLLILKNIGRANLLIMSLTSEIYLT